jgi:hypothetical protein
MYGRKVTAGMVLVLAMCWAAGSADGAQLPAYELDEQPLRVRVDAPRNRVWVLDVNEVRVYDSVEKRMIRRLVLPNWSVARYVCPPDLVLDAAGSATISSNVVAKLWRIDGAGFGVAELEIRLHERENWDTGFGALALAAGGALLGATSSNGSVWRIDVGDGSARMIDPEATHRDLCELPPPLVNDLERRRKS